ncbi:MAG: FkbM family methyltransferase [Caldilineaceae bacterium]
MQIYQQVRKIPSVLSNLLKNLGRYSALIFFVRYAVWRFGLEKLLNREKFTYVMKSPKSAVPLLCRHNTSDIQVFRQVFVDCEYACLDDINSPKFIVDCGANVGYTSAYLLTKFPDAFLIGIEPDPHNFRLIEANLKPFEDRVRLLNAAVWSQAANLVFDSNRLSDGQESARRVQETTAWEGVLVKAIDIGTILDESKYNRISILKIDIEGAENVIFSANYEAWINKVDNIVIELHSEESKEIFFRAIADLHFHIATSGELIVCKLKADKVDSKSKLDSL